MCTKMGMVINRGKGNRALNEVKSFEKTSKNPQNFLKISFVKKDVLPLQKLQDDGYE